jgi:glycosyltransferase involved in cell wall biosynthesis
VFPSLYEGWGLPIVEAFQTGLPVACSNVTSLPELVADAALVFDPRDLDAMAAAIRRLWIDDAFAAELIRLGHLRGACFSWYRTGLTLRALYRQVAGRPINEDDRRLVEAQPIV